MLLGVWKKEFHAVSWQITVHSYDLSETHCECNCDRDYTDSSNIRKYESVLLEEDIVSQFLPALRSFLILTTMTL